MPHLRNRIHRSSVPKNGEVRSGSSPCENSNACRARRNILEKLRIMRTDAAADIRLDAVLENYIFYMSPMYEFLHSLGQTRPRRLVAKSSNVHFAPIATTLRTCPKPGRNARAIRFSSSSASRVFFPCRLIAELQSGRDRGSAHPPDPKNGGPK